MSLLAALAFFPVWAVALMVGLTALRLGSRRGLGLPMVCFTQAGWISGLMLLTTPASHSIALHLLPLGMLEAGAFVHALSDLTEGATRKYVVPSYLLTALIAAVGAVSPPLLYGPQVNAPGPWFMPLSAAAVVATGLVLILLLRSALAAAGANRKRLVALLAACLLGSLGGGGTLALMVFQLAESYIAAPLLLGSTVLESYATLRDEDPRLRSLFGAGIGYATLTALVSSVGLTAYAFLLPRLVPTGESLLPWWAWAMLITFLSTLPLDPLRQLVVEGLGRRLFRTPLAVRDLREVAQASEVKAEQSARLAELGTFVGAVAHEVRNPLGIIMAQAKLLERQGAKPETVAALRREVERARSFLEELLRFAKPRPLELREVNVLPLIERALERARQAKPRTPFELELRVPSTLEVQADEQALEDALLVLIDNALIELTERPDAKLTINAERLREGLCIAVEDNGRGVPSAIEPRLFQPFVTGRGRDQVHLGTGLGLAIAAGWVERHGGSLSHQRPTAGGARFVVLLPHQPAYPARP